MDGSRNKRVGIERWSKVDYLSNLPESLLNKVLLNLRTKDVVRTSVLSKRWRNLWRYVPGLDLNRSVFPDYITFFSFIDAFLGFNSESYLESFKLDYDWSSDSFNRALRNYKPVNDIVKRLINTVVDRRVKHLVVLDNSVTLWNLCEFQMPPTIYTCESLVSLKLYRVELASPIPISVSLPCLKFMDLSMIYVSLDLDLETLISGCPVLESLFIETSFVDVIQVIRVCSQSLLRFTYISDGYRISNGEDFVVDINAPRLQYLRLGDICIGSFILNHTNSLVEVYIDTVSDWSFENNFKNDLQKRKMIDSFLEGISCVKDVTITSKTLEVFYHYSKCQQLPLFRNLFFLRVSFPTNFRWKMLPIFLESCPNLKSIVLAYDRFSMSEPPELGILSGPRCLLPSLEYVDIEIPLTAMEMEVVRYFLENSVTLKKLTVRLAASTKDSLLCDINLKDQQESAALLNELLAIPRHSSCQVIVL